MEPSSTIAILIVDDHASIREGLTVLIKQVQDMHVIAEAANGQEAIDLFRQHHPDVVLMDYKMPVMDGIEATHRICQEFPSAAILLFTACALEQEFADARQAGAKGHLLKEASKEDLISAIHAIVSTSTEN